MDMVKQNFRFYRLNNVYFLVFMVNHDLCDVIIYIIMKNSSINYVPITQISRSKKHQNVFILVV